MSLDAYSACPCGSGKKFKWCCQPIHAEISQAFAQEEAGQHDTALQLMERVVNQHPGNPEAWGRKADLLYRMNRADEAEAALQKSLEINPNYPFGLYLQGMIRYSENELPGALLLLRRAADAYDPGARDVVGTIQARIGEIELQLNRPVAALAAARIALHLMPQDEKLRESFETVFGPDSRLPGLARKEYKFRAALHAANAAHRSRWDQALQSAATGRLSDAGKAFQELARQNSDDIAAWYNLGLALAWLGQNKESIEAFDRYIALEPDEASASEAAALSGILRTGHGMEEQADYLEYWSVFELKDGDGVPRLLEEWNASRRLANGHLSEDQTYFSALVLEKPAALTPELAATRPLRLGANLLIFGPTLRISHASPGSLETIRQEISQVLGPSVAGVRSGRGPAHFQDLLLEALTFPQTEDIEKAKSQFAEHLERFFEETWAHRPLHSLDDVSPIDAAGHPVLRKKLLGAVAFLEDVAPVEQYDYNRLRRRLGIMPEDQPAPPRPPDIGAMGAVELSSLSASDLPAADLESAFQSAKKLDARELATRFAKALVQLPPRADRPDRFPWYFHLVQEAASDGRVDEALEWILAGEKVDAQEFGGRRHDSYDLRRAQLLARKGEVSEAENIFNRLITSRPEDVRFRGAAAEAMLGARQAEKARGFAEAGLSTARKQNARDSEQYFAELLDAAKRLASH